MKVRMEIETEADAKAPMATGREKGLLARLDFWKAEEKRHGKLSGRLANLRLVAFAGFICVVVALWREVVPVSWMAVAIALAAGFIGLAVIHDKVIRRERLACLRVSLLKREDARRKRDWDALKRLPGGREGLLKDGVARDLGILGPRSLVSLMDGTVSEKGFARLTELLLQSQASADGVLEGRSRQEAVRELSGLDEFRERLEAAGRLWTSGAHELRGRSRESAADVLDEGDVSSVAGWIGADVPGIHPLWTLAAWGLPGVTAILFVLCRMTGWNEAVWAVPMAVQCLLAVAFSVRRRDLLDFPGVQSERLEGFADMFRVVAGQEFSSALLARLRAGVSGKDCPVSPWEALDRMGWCAGFQRLRQQPILHGPLAALLLIDIHAARYATSLRASLSPRWTGWFESLGEIEALSSLAASADLFEKCAWPSLTDGCGLRIAEMTHPLLVPGRCVANDVSLASRRTHTPGGNGGADDGAPSPAVLVVTGSNMAGKTTYLRAIGTCLCLARAGAAVPASSMETGAFRVTTAMGVFDSLGDGVSLFLAQVRRIREVVDAAKAAPTLFLLDEVLHGTNEGERRRASLAVVNALVDEGAIGAVATHDLTLASLAQERSGVVANVHFTDTFEDGGLKFDYRVRPGLVSTSNALKVIRMAGIDIPGLEG